MHPLQRIEQLESQITEMVAQFEATASTVVDLVKRIESLELSVTALTASLQNRP